ncbi:MAG: GTP 3',8-cyclase MoaA [Acidobacteriota bacterium]
MTADRSPTAASAAPRATAPTADGGPHDRLGRPLRDLRLSVTDRCSFRCDGCMPKGRRYAFAPRADLLRFEELVRITRVACTLGVRTVRITGGEPLLRRDLPTLVEALSGLGTLDDLALTTNGQRLADAAPALADAGLQRVTISLHSLDPARFSDISGVGASLDDVLAGVRVAAARGLRPVKLNMVVMKDVNEDDIVPLARFARNHGHVARYIEYMDVGTVNAWDQARVVPAREIVARIDRVWPLEAIAGDRPDGTAQRYRFRDGGGEIGVIPSVTAPFCGSCTRLRVSSQGQLYTCLFGRAGVDLRTPLRDGIDDDQLRGLLANRWRQRDDRYSEQRTADLEAGRFVPQTKVEMFRIGG